MLKTYKCAVAGINAGGESDLFFVAIKGTREQYADGCIETKASAIAQEEGFTHCVVFTNKTSVGRLLTALNEWEHTKIYEA
jgi:hypothetical protein